MTQVVTNLLSNAVKYSPQGGNIFIRSRQEGLVAHISLQDQGIGIRQDALEQIFAPYHRVEATSSRHIQGTGLGLTAVRQIVQMHGGQIWAESGIGQGSLFHVILPIKAVSALASSDTPEKVPDQ